MPADRLARHLARPGLKTLYLPLEAIQGHVEEAVIRPLTDADLSRLPGSFIQNAFLKVRFEYYWEMVFECATRQRHGPVDIGGQGSP